MTNREKYGLTRYCFWMFCSPSMLIESFISMPIRSVDNTTSHYFPQIVRSDIKELWDMSLEGAPYAFTPFCKDRNETSQFRFWDSGYWENHLRGKPYHIRLAAITPRYQINSSALFVVDLKKFRQDHVGTELRALYNHLSQDPGSLANLDQDLPNFAQHVVPIFSLPPVTPNSPFSNIRYIGMALV